MKRYLTYAMLFAFLLLGLTACSRPAFLSQADANLTDDRETVVVLHGLGRSKMAMWRLINRLEGAGYRVESIGYSSLQNTPQGALKEVADQLIKKPIQNAKTVHFVGHSLGGLLIRAYLSKKTMPNLGRVVMLGTPNHGTTVVDNFKDKWWFKMFGPLSESLGTDANSFPNSLDTPTYPFGVIAGKSESNNEDILPGVDDGLVSVASTKLKGMKDFIIVETGHSMMRYNKAVAEQTIHFLKTETFLH